jgi:hypothetical protein
MNSSKVTFSLAGQAEAYLPRCDGWVEGKLPVDYRTKVSFPWIGIRGKVTLNPYEREQGDLQLSVPGWSLPSAMRRLG